MMALIGNEWTTQMAFKSAISSFPLNLKHLDFSSTGLSTIQLIKANQESHSTYRIIAFRSMVRLERNENHSQKIAILGQSKDRRPDNISSA
jgi:hypothetical protein